MTDPELQTQLRNLHEQCPNAGQMEMMARLRADGLQVQQRRVRSAMQIVDPVGTATRWASVIQRRTYHVKSPNSLWHMDTNHALRRFATHFL